MRVVCYVHGADGLEPPAGKPLHSAVKLNPQSRKRIPVSGELLIRTKMFGDVSRIIDGRVF